MSTDSNSTKPLEGDAALIRAVGSFALAARSSRTVRATGRSFAPNALSMPFSPSVTVPFAFLQLAVSAEVVSFPSRL